MRKFTMGLVAGSVIGTMGIGYAMSDRKARNQIIKKSKKMMKKGKNVMEQVSDFL